MYYSYKVFGSARGNLTPRIMWRDVRSTAPVCPLASSLRSNTETKRRAKEANRLTS